jgi:hypothetical protein
MLQRFIRSVGLVIAAVALLGGGAKAADPAPQRIVAVGDLHGDYDAWIDVARGAGLIDARKNWIGGKTLLVQLGDVTDREPDSLKIIRHLMQLQRTAPRSGGRVIVLLGNHEAMNLLGDLRYTTPGEFAEFATSKSAQRREELYQANRAQIEAAYRARDPKLTPEAIHDAWIKVTPLGWVEQREAWKPDGEIGRWARNNPAVLKIGDTLFAHGGISAEYAKFSLDKINARAASAMATVDDSDASILNDALGPLWYRGLILKNDPEALGARGNRPPPDLELETVLRAYGVKRLVVGHTPSRAGIIITPDGKLARIDTGMSRYYGGPLTYLEIIGDQMIPHTVKRSGS